MDSLFKVLYCMRILFGPTQVSPVLINPLSHKVYILLGTLTEFRATLPSHYLGINEVNVHFLP